MEPGPSSYSLIALVLGDLESWTPRTRRNQVRSTSERSRALAFGAGGDRREQRGTRGRRQGKRLVVLMLVPFPISLAGSCVDWLLPVDDVRSI